MLTIIQNQFSCLVIQLKYHFLWFSENIICIIDVLYRPSTKLQMLCQKYNLCNLFYNLLIWDHCIDSTDALPCHVRMDDQHNGQLSASCAKRFKLTYHQGVKKNSDLKNGHMEFLSFAQKHAFPTVTVLFE